jgi:acetyl esterase/lipase
VNQHIGRPETLDLTTLLDPQLATVITPATIRGVDYAVRLNHAGVATELHVYPGAPHGYQFAAGSGIAKRAYRDKTAWLARRLHGAFKFDALTY